MKNEKVFRTKTGFCHILPDKIILSRDGIIGNIAKITVGNNIKRILIVHSVIFIFLVYIAYKEFQSKQYHTLVIPILLGIFFLYGIISSLNNSATPIIERKSIKKVQFKRGIPGITRSRFEVYFEDRDKKIRKRLIMLPGSMKDGNSETEKALKIMKEEKLIY